MRHLLAVALLALSCAADPVLLPDASGVPDTGPCGGACGAGTVCAAGACVAVDAGRAVDVQGADAGGDATGRGDVGEDRAADTGPTDAGSDVGSDVGDDATRDVPPTALPDGSHFWDVVCEGCGAAHSTCVCGETGAVYTCNPGFADCDGNVLNGCEVNVWTSVMNCGACGTSCGPVRRCFDGRCR